MPTDSIWNAFKRRFGGRNRQTEAVVDVDRQAEAVVGVEDSDYDVKMKQEFARYKDVENVNLLPHIFAHWSNTYLRPMCEEFGVSHPHEWFAKNLAESAARAGVERPVFISIGAGNCDTEVFVAKIMREMGCEGFTIECLDMNDSMLARGKAMAEKESVAEFITFTSGDFNHWRATRQYAGIMANQSLHHVTNLEGLFDEIKRALHPQGMFVIGDIIGRNGHMRWPEALDAVHKFWQELPPEYRYNQLLKRHEELYDNWDCSGEGFEGIRAQDILPLLLERFEFYKFIAFGNVIDPFVDRCFGHNFDGDGAWDKDLIDRIHAFDEQGFADGSLTPTHMFAALTIGTPPERLYSRGLQPERCVRKP